MLLLLSKSAFPSYSDSSPCPATLASLSSRDPDSSCLNPWHLPTDTRAGQHRNLSLGKESSQEIEVGGFLFVSAIVSKLNYFRVTIFHRVLPMHLSILSHFSAPVPPQCARSVLPAHHRSICTVPGQNQPRTSHTPLRQ